MTETTAPRRPRPGISIEDAAALLCALWIEYKEAPEREPAEDLRLGVQIKRGVKIDKPFMRQLLSERSRDCGWCIFHSHGDKGLSKLHDQAVKGVARGRDRDQFYRCLERAFHGIGDWRV